MNFGKTDPELNVLGNFGESVPHTFKPGSLEPKKMGMLFGGNASYCYRLSVKTAPVMIGHCDYSRKVVRATDIQPAIVYGWKIKA